MSALARTTTHLEATGSRTGAESPAREAFRILRFGYAAAPILAGADKFVNLLTDWEQYLPPALARLAAGRTHEVMMFVGVVEIVAGIGVALRPRLFAYVVAAWLLAITAALTTTVYLDVALRDFGLAVGAFALARLSRADVSRVRA